MLFNITGHPGVIIPLGLTRGRLPFGAQLVGRRWSDRRLLAIADTLSAVAGPCGVPPGYE
jgi:amidase